jgi:hypothetical protein
VPAPGIGAVTLALLFGLFNLIYATWGLMQRLAAPDRQDPALRALPWEGEERGLRQAELTPSVVHWH